MSLAPQRSDSAIGSVSPLLAHLMSFHSEPSREIPVVDRTDVIVCGGGPAGVAAALAAARAGARVTLIESQGCLGGIWTSGLLSYIIDADASKGFGRELVSELTRRDRRAPETDHHAPAERPTARPGILYSAETMKVVLEDLCTKAGIRLRLHSRVVAAACDEANRLAVVVTESKNGREAWAAKVFIDCTGDGDVAAQAGCGFETGRPGSGAAQPMTLMALLTGPAFEEVSAFVTAGRGDHYTGKTSLLAELRRAGCEPSYHQPSLFHIRDELYALMANHQYGGSGLDAEQLTRATLEARREVFGIVQALRALGGVWRRLELVATASHIGVREGRRIRGRYQVTREDLIAGARHPDAVCRVDFPVDVHSTNPNQDKGYTNEGIQALPYDIPLRALVARDVEGLLLAGRCISGDFFAHASYRVTGYAMELGDAAGRTAAWCAHHACLPSKADWREISAAQCRPNGAGRSAKADSIVV